MNARPECSQNLEVLLEIPLELTVQVASCSKSTAEVLRVSAGSVVEFDESANDPVGLYVNHKLVARGELVAVEGQLGIKVTEVVARR